MVEERGDLLRRRRDLLRLRRRRHRRPGRADPAHGLPRRARRDLPVADAVLPDAGPGRRVRRDRPVRGGQPARHARRPRRAGAHGERPRHPRDRRPRRQPHLRPAPVVQGGPAQQGQPLPRLLRLALRPAAGHLRQGRLPGQGGQHLGARRAHRRVVPAPLLLPPARPQLRQPGGARPHREVHRVLAAAGPGRVPRRRRAVPHRRHRHRRRRRARRPARVPQDAAVVPRPAPRRRDPARRGQPAAQGAARLLRRLRRRRAHHDVRLHRHGGDVPLAGARGRPAAGHGR